jgi:hypothetical protein
MISPGTKCQHVANVSLIILFMGLISLPAAWNLAGPREASGGAERRQLAARPELKLTRHGLQLFPDQFEAFFSDHFGLRTTLIHWLDRAEVSWLKVSSSPKVILGKKDWLFLTEAPVAKGCQPSEPFTPDQLTRWQKMLEARHDWLARRGIRYLVVLVPEKQTIYPEELPRKYRPFQTQGTRLDQLISHLHAHSDVPVLDLREPLRQAKSHERLYHLTDAHWNERGAYVGYRRIVETLEAWLPGMEPWPRSDFNDVAVSEPSGDCARLLGVDHELREEFLKLVPKRPYLTQGSTDGFPPAPAWISPPFAMYQANPRLPRAVMFCDSFTSSMFPFLAQHFQRIAFIWQIFPTFDMAVVEREQPDVVIQEMVERKLQYPDMVEHQLVPVIPPDFVDEPADSICRTARKWSTFLLGEN